MVATTAFCLVLIVLTVLVVLVVVSATVKYNFKTLKN